MYRVRESFWGTVLVLQEFTLEKWRDVSCAPEAFGQFEIISAAALAFLNQQNDRARAADRRASRQRKAAEARRAAQPPKEQA